MPASTANRTAIRLSIILALLLFRLAAIAGDSLVVSFRYDDPGKQKLRTFVPAVFNNWGSNDDGRIAIADTSRMWYDSTGEYWWKSWKLAVDSTYAYKFHFHYDSAGTDWEWIPDPLNLRLDNSGFGNSLITIGSPLLSEARATRDLSGSLTEVRAGIAGTAPITAVRLIADGDSTDILPYYNSQRGILLFPLPSPSTAHSVTLAAIDALGRRVTYHWTFSPPATTKPWENEVFYQIFPRSFYDSDGDSTGDFNGIAAKLDDLQQLGITALWLNPIFLSRAYHNYYADSFDTTDIEFGTNTDFINLVKAVHARGMKIFIDMETQYISSFHPWYVSASNNPSSPYSQYIWWNGPNNTQPESRNLNSYDGQQIPVITLNMNTPAQISYQKKMYAYWCDPNGDGRFDDGVDGFRIDHIMDNLDYRNENINLFANFWRPLFDTLRSINPAVFFLCEQADWADYGTTTLTGSDADAMFTIPLMFAVRSLSKSNITGAIANTLAATPEGKHQFTIIENHDVDRFASAVGESSGLERAGAAFNLLLPGVPCLYYGQEIGMRGRKGNWGTDGNDIPLREAMKWHASVNGPGMSLWYANSGPWWTSSALHDSDGVSVEEEQHDSSSLWNYYRALIAVRKAHPAFRAGSYSAISNANNNVVAWGRQSSGDSVEYVAVAVNLASTPQSVTLNFSPFLGILQAPVAVSDLIGHRTYPDVSWSNVSSYTIALAPNEVSVVRFAASSMTATVSAGWNLLSMPYTSTSGKRNVIYPFSTSNAFAYAGSYYPIDTVRPGTGFWLKFDTTAAISYHGSDRLIDTIPVVPGWNLIGVLSKPLAAAQVQGIPPGLTTSPFYRYDGGYFPADTLQPGNGYWIRSAVSAALLLDASGAAAHGSHLSFVNTGELPPPPPVALTDVRGGVPARFRLYQNYPNPFNPVTTIRFDLPVEARVTIRIYSILGTQVAAPLHDTIVKEGYKEITFDASGLASGVYMYRMDAESMPASAGGRGEKFTAGQKMMVLK